MVRGRPALGDDEKRLLKRPELLWVRIFCLKADALRGGTQLERVSVKWNIESKIVRRELFQLSGCETIKIKYL